MTTAVVIGLSAVVIAMKDGEASVLTVRPRDEQTDRASTLEGLPFGPFDPDGHRTFELALREFVTRQTRFDLGYVEQLYTFGDKGRDAPLADVGAGGARVISVGYLALAPSAVETEAPGSRLVVLVADFFPWEDWRRGRPEIIDQAHRPGPGSAGPAAPRAGRGRAALAVRPGRLALERGAGAGALRAALRGGPRARGGPRPRPRRRRRPAEPAALAPALGEPMISDHRRILATGLGRLRGKLKYRPVVFELMPEAFTLSALQRTVEAIAGVALHKQNFRRVVERTGLVEGLGRMDAGHRRPPRRTLPLPPRTPDRAPGVGRRCRCCGTRLRAMQPS